MRRSICTLVLLAFSGVGFGQTVTSQQAEILTSPRDSTIHPLLFPYLVATSGFDTQITISNTSEDTAGSTPLGGTCTLSFYGVQQGLPYTATQTTSSIPAGSQLSFSVTQGGGGLTGISGFEGYVIASCGFPLARGTLSVGSGNVLISAQDAQLLTLPRSQETYHVMVFPFVDSKNIRNASFDTGIAIADTSEDPFGTPEASNSCTIYGYSAGLQPVVPSCNTIVNPLPGTNCFGVVPPGQIGSVLASQVLPGFQGYAVAVCGNPAVGTGAPIDLQTTGATEIPQTITFGNRDTTVYPLLFPFVTAADSPALDTLITIANTTLDPFGTENVSGPCTLRFHGSNAPAGSATVTNVAAGTVYTTTLSSIAPGFSGYMTASCAFPDAMGWAAGMENGDLSGFSVAAEQVALPRSTSPTSLLFTRTANWPNVDTAIHIANTSDDPFGTAPASGSCKISYFGQTGNGGNAPAAQTSSTIQAGTSLNFTLSGGNAAQGIAAAPGFHGYIIADCGFPVARGVAAVYVVSPALTIASSHSGSFFQGQLNAAYTLTVANPLGAGATSGIVTVTENPPPSLTLGTMSGTGWTCSANTCTRSDGLNPGSSYSPIAVTVSVASGAPGTVTNQVSVSGGGSATASNSDSTTIAAPELTIVSSHTGDFSLAQYGATYTLSVSSAATGGPAGVSVTVTDNLPSGLRLISMAGAGWTCTEGGNTCKRSDALNPGASYPSITVTVLVAGNAPSSVTNQASVSIVGVLAVTASDATTVGESPCDLTQNRNISLPDIQLLIGQILGTAAPTYSLTGNTSVTVTDAQTEIDAVIGLGCPVPTK
jgi:hypothetical protein